MAKLDGSLIGKKILGNLAASTGSFVITKDNQVVFTADQLSPIKTEISCFSLLKKLALLRWSYLLRT